MLMLIADKMLAKDAPIELMPIGAGVAVGVAALASIIKLYWGCAVERFEGITYFVQYRVVSFHAPG
jgi:uncharacterized membrane protein